MFWAPAGPKPLKLLACTAVYALRKSRSTTTILCPTQLSLRSSPYAHFAGKGLAQGVCKKLAYAACSAWTRLMMGQVRLYAARLLATARVVARGAQVRRHELAHPLPEEFALPGVGPAVGRVDKPAPGVVEPERLVGGRVVRGSHGGSRRLSTPQPSQMQPKLLRVVQTK